MNLVITIRMYIDIYSAPCLQGAYKFSNIIYVSIHTKTTKLQEIAHDFFEEIQLHGLSMPPLQNPWAPHATSSLDARSSSVEGAQNFVQYDSSGALNALHAVQALLANQKIVAGSFVTNRKDGGQGGRVYEVKGVAGQPQGVQVMLALVDKDGTRQDQFEMDSERFLRDFVLDTRKDFELLPWPGKDIANDIEFEIEMHKAAVIMAMYNFATLHKDAPLYVKSKPSRGAFVAAEKIASGKVI